MESALEGEITDYLGYDLWVPRTVSQSLISAFTLVDLNITVPGQRADR